jgi:ABC-2 type transport system ATP-binding protein
MEVIGTDPIAFLFLRFELARPPAIEIRDLIHKYGDRCAVDKINLQIEEGEIFGLLGPNGGGKTTLFRILSTLLKPTSGEVKVLGLDPNTQSAEIRSRIGVVFQSPSLDAKLTVQENLIHQGHLHGLRGRKLKDRIDGLLSRMGLAARKHDRAEVLSGGLLRRVDLVRGLLHRPDLLIFDEPSTGLDPGVRRTYWTDLERLRESDGTTLILTTHFIEEAERCDRVGILDQGKLVGEGRPSDLKKAVGKDVIVIEADDVEGLSEDLGQLDGITPIVVDGTLRIECVDGHHLMGELYTSFRDRMSAITLGKPTLEDVFVRETGHSLQSDPGIE